MTTTPRARPWLMPTLVFLGCLPLGLALGVALIGHARALPYVSVWLDRLVLAAATLGLPGLAALAAHRLLAARRPPPR
jgi:hypothetical protein